MIYFVDEDIPYAKEFSIPLILRGYEIKILSNADHALTVLSKASDIQLVVIDIMLATGPAENSKFTADETEGFLKTGLVLMKYLELERPDIYPNKVVALTAASESSLVTFIERICDGMNVSVLRKSDFRRPKLLADRLVEIIGLR